MRKQKDLTLAADKEYNTTELHPDTAFERHVYHRDMFAHFLRWSHVLRDAKIGQTVLDFGCGSGDLLEVFYRNKYRPKKYLGLDIRPQLMKKLNEKYKNVPFAEFQAVDLAKPFKLDNKVKWDIICTFETAEHINKKNIGQFLDNIKALCSDKTTVYLSTPNYDPEVGPAQNHVYDGQINEFEHKELQKHLEKRFKIVAKYGTFASQKDYKHLLTKDQLQLWNKLSEYYDTNLIAVIFAPLFPEQARNCLWKLKLK